MRFFFLITTLPFFSASMIGLLYKMKKNTPCVFLIIGSRAQTFYEQARSYIPAEQRASARACSHLAVLSASGTCSEQTETECRPAAGVKELSH